MTAILCGELVHDRRLHLPQCTEAHVGTCALQRTAGALPPACMAARTLIDGVARPGRAARRSKDWRLLPLQHERSVCTVEEELSRVRCIRRLRHVRGEALLASARCARTNGQQTHMASQPADDAGAPLATSHGDGRARVCVCLPRPVPYAATTAGLYRCFQRHLTQTDGSGRVAVDAVVHVPSDIVHGHGSAPAIELLLHSQRRNKSYEETAGSPMHGWYPSGNSTWPSDTRETGSRYCMPWTTDGATRAGAASPSTCQAQCDAVRTCVAITWYPEHSYYSDQCYLFDRCDRTGKSANGGAVWRRTSTVESTPPPPAPSPPPPLPSPVPPPSHEFLVHISILGLLPALPVVLVALVGLLWTLHVWHQRRRGRTTACCGRVSLVRPQPPRAHVVAEQSAQSAIEMLPCERWTRDAASRGDDEDAATALCALCLQNYERGDEVTRLPGCGHEFHTACVTRWLAEAQRGKKRRCPLCNLDPLAVTTPPTTPSAPSSSSSPSSTPLAHERPAAPHPSPPLGFAEIDVASFASHLVR